MDNQIEKKIIEILLNVLHKIDLSHMSDGDLDFIHKELLHKGYHHRDIQMVLNWVMTQSMEQEPVENITEHSKNHFRVLHEMEKAYLAPDAQGFLMNLSTNGLMGANELEDILLRVMWLGQENLSRVDLQDFIRVLFSISNMDEETPIPEYGLMMPESPTFH